VNRPKYENAILFFAERVRDLGRVKLNKLLYFADFDHFEKYGEAITGDVYLNHELGPVPSHIQDVLADMIRERKVEVVSEPLIDFVRFRLKPLVPCRADAFAPSEIEMLCSVVAKWGAHTAREIVMASHGEAPWIATRKGEDIPYPLAYYRGKFGASEPDYDSERLASTTTAI